MTKTQQKVQLLVAGTGKQKDIYENLCTRFELSSRVTFLGKQSENQLAKLYERVTAVAYPSRSPETFGLVGIEAMSYGTPVIASAVGGVGEWLKDGENGIAVPAGDDDSLARAIDRLVSDPTLASSMGERGRRLYEARFRPERHVDSLHALFSGLLGKIDPT